MGAGGREVDLWGLEQEDVTCVWVRGGCEFTWPLEVVVLEFIHM